MNDAVRWGVLGVAGINAAMVPALQAAPSAELVAIASRRPGRAEQAAADAGIELAFASYEELLADESIEAVYLPVPNAQHARWTIEAIAAGKHVLCEKPMAVTADEARAMTEAARAAGVVLAEAFMYVHHPRYALVRDLVRGGEIGTVRAMHTVFTFDASDERTHSGFQGAPGSGAVYDVGCYAVHATRYLLDGEVEAVTAHAAVSADHGGIDMSTSMLLEMPDGVGATAQVGMWSADQDTIAIIGSTGRIDIPHAFLCGVDDGDVLVTVGDEHRTVQVPRRNHYVEQVEQFCAAVCASSNLSLPSDDAVQGARVMEALTRSWRHRERVTL